METVQCRWCGIPDPTFAESHIIPKAFFNHDGQNDRKIYGLGQHPKRRRTGSWDNKILCRKCEDDFKDIDSEAAKILLHQFEKNLIPFNDKKDEVAFQLDGKYKKAVKQFLIYTLWKASVSRLPEFAQISLGPYEDRIKEDLISDKDFDFDEYSFSAFRLEKHTGNLYPRKLKTDHYGDRLFYELNFVNLIFHIKIDKRSSPEPLKSLIEHPHIIFNRLEEEPMKRKKAMIDLLKRAPS